MKKFNLTLTQKELDQMFHAILVRYQRHLRKFGENSIVTKETHDLYTKILQKSVKADKLMEVK